MNRLMAGADISERWRLQTAMNAAEQRTIQSSAALVQAINAPSPLLQAINAAPPPPAPMASSEQPAPKEPAPAPEEPAPEEPTPAPEQSVPEERAPALEEPAPAPEEPGEAALYATAAEQPAATSAIQPAESREINPYIFRIPQSVPDDPESIPDDFSWAFTPEDAGPMPIAQSLPGTPKLEPAAPVPAPEESIPDDFSWAFGPSAESGADAEPESAAEMGTADESQPAVEATRSDPVPEAVFI